MRINKDCHPGAGRGLGQVAMRWVPAFAGMTLLMMLFSACVLPFKLKVRGKCDGSIGIDEAGYLICPSRRPTFLEASNEPQ